jgi:monoamine oxidase
VVGAGLSGLNAALILERWGYEVRVIEAKERVGGRLWTLDHMPGSPEGWWQRHGR